MKELRICSALEMVIKELRKAKEPIKPKVEVPFKERKFSCEYEKPSQK